MSPEQDITAAELCSVTNNQKGIIRTSEVAKLKGYDLLKHLPNPFFQDMIFLTIQ